MKRALAVFLCGWHCLTGAEWADLDAFLLGCDLDIIEGHITEAQAKVFALDLSGFSGLRIAEIGFNAGHSAYCFLKHCPQATVVSFDLGEHNYVPFGQHFLQHKYPGRFELILGNSFYTVPLYATTHPGQTFDLIFIDGGHSLSAVFHDLSQCQRIAHPRTWVWIDDYNQNIQQAAELLIKQEILELLAVKEDGSPEKRTWAIARYLF